MNRPLPIDADGNPVKIAPKARIDAGFTASEAVLIERQRAMNAELRKIAPNLLNGGEPSAANLARACITANRTAILATAATKRAQTKPVTNSSKVIHP